MKRLALAAVALAVAQGAHAADDVEFKMGGDFRARYENWMTPSATSNNPASTSDVKSRARLNVTARRGERLQMMVSLLHGATFGATSAGNNADQTGQTTGGAYNTGTNNDAVQVSRAWGWWKATDGLTFKVGRMGIELGDGSVFSENDWEQNPTMHEGLMVGYEMDFAKISLYLVKNHEYGVGGATPVGDPSWDPEQNMYLLSFDFKNLPEALKTANLHLVQITRDASSDTTTYNDTTGSGADVGTNHAGLNEQRIGLSVGGEAANIMYKLSGAYVFGKGKLRAAQSTIAGDQDLDINQNMVDAMVGYHAADVMGLKVGVGFHMDSGSDNVLNNGNGGADKSLKTYDPMFYDQHNNAGLMDVVRWGNLTYFDVTASIMPMEDLEAGIAWYMFSRTSTGNNAAATTFGRGYSLLSGKGSESAIGNELDIFANKSYEGNFKIGAHIGMFMPDNYLKNVASQDQTIYQGMLQGTMTF